MGLPEIENERSQFDGYHDCPCRDCFEIAIGETDGEPDLCNACEKSGCDASGESGCNAPHAYNQHCGDVACCGAYDLNAGEGE